jgi:hypothetical protein
MPELNVMLLEHAKSGAQAELDTAVTNGDTEAARKAADKISALNAAAAPAPSTAYGDKEIRAELNKQAWFGIDPKKSARTIELGKNMDPKKFGTAAEFTAALVKIVDEEFKVKPAAEGEGDGEGEGEGDGEGEGEKKPEKKPRASDGPGDGDTGGNRTPRRASGPWTKMSDAPADIQKEINRTADKFAPKTKEGREKYIAKSLEAQYNRAQLNKAKK